MQSPRAIAAEHRDAYYACIVAEAAFERGFKISECVIDDINDAIEDGADTEIDPRYMRVY